VGRGGPGGAGGGGARAEDGRKRTTTPNERFSAGTRACVRRGERGFSVPGAERGAPGSAARGRPRSSPRARGSRRNPARGTGGGGPMMRQGRRRCARDRGTALSSTSTEGGSRATRRGCERGRRARTKETHVIHARLRGARPRASSRHGGVAASAASAGAENAVVFLEPAGGRPTRRELLFLGAGGGSISQSGRIFRSWFERSWGAVTRGRSRCRARCPTPRASTRSSRRASRTSASACRARGPATFTIPRAHPVRLNADPTPLTAPPPRAGSA